MTELYVVARPWQRLAPADPLLALLLSQYRAPAREQAAGVIHLSAAPLSSLNYPPPLFPFNQLPAKLSLLQMLRGGPCPVTSAATQIHTTHGPRKLKWKKEKMVTRVRVVCCFVFSTQVAGCDIALPASHHSISCWLLLSIGFHLIRLYRRSSCMERRRKIGASRNEGLFPFKIRHDTLFLTWSD